MVSKVTRSGKTVFPFLMTILYDMNFHVRCDKAHKSVSVYLISIFCSCSTVNCWSQKTNFKIITKISSTPRSKFTEVLSNKHNIMLMTLFMNQINFYSRKYIAGSKNIRKLVPYCFIWNSSQNKALIFNFFKKKI